MTGFGDFANIDIDKLLRESQQRFARAAELQERMANLVGRAESEDGRVTATYTTGGGLTALELDPRAMRMASGELAETIKSVIHAAARNLQEQSQEVMVEVFGEDENPMQFLTDRDALESKAQEMQSTYDRTMNDVMGGLEAVKKRLGL